MNNKPFVRLFAALALLALFCVGAAAQTNTHAGGQSGTVAQNALIKSIGPNHIAGANITDDGTTVAVSGQFAKSTVTALTAGATVSVNPALGDIFTITPGEDETLNAASVKLGQRLTVFVTTSGSTSRTLTFSTNFRTTGTLATGTTTAKTFVIEFFSVDGVKYTEVSRTAAQ
jgi:hypothetical protein